MKVGTITKELEEFRSKVEYAAKEKGLDFFDTRFHMVDWDDMIQLMSYNGFPKLPAHWSHGMKSIILENQYRYGLMKVYELVINNDPAHAYLLRNNTETENEFVICHVYGHVDFFKNNLWFSKTNRDMVKEMYWQAEKQAKLSERYGPLNVEKFADTCHTLDTLIDPYSLFYETNFESLDQRLKESELPSEKPRIIKTGDEFLDRVLNNDDYRKKEMDRIEKEKASNKRFPRKMQKDVVKFLIDNAKYSNHNLENWKLDMLDMYRDQFYYFAPQRVTKIMNEGWASYWHYKLMVEEGFAGDKGLFEFTKLHGDVTAIRQQPGPVNPYALGLALWRWIEYKWDTGKHGTAFENCRNRDEKRSWDTRDMKGKEKIFEVRKYYNDLLFLTEFMDQEFCDEHKLWTYGQDRFGNIVVESKDVNRIKDQLIRDIYNSGDPLIYIKDADFQNKGELLLYHDFDFAEKMLDIVKTMGVMHSIREIWGKDVSIETKLPAGTEDEQEYQPARILCTEKNYVFYTYNDEGEEISENEIGIDAGEWR